MSVQVYGCNHIVIEVTDAKKAVKFYQDVFGLKMLRGGEGAAWCKLGEHQFMAIFEVDTLQPDRTKHFGLMVRDEKQIKEVRKKLINKYKLKPAPGFRCDFRDPWGNNIQVVDYRDIQFTKTDRVLEGMGLTGLGKSERALVELRAKGLSD